jgi:hypothetical protein
MGKLSSLFSVNLRERIKTLTITIVGTMATAIYQVVNQAITDTGKFPVTIEEWQQILLIGISTGISAGALYFGVTFSSNGNTPGLLEKTLSKKKEGNIN